ncbi:MAG: hypothetical protein ACRDJ2_09955 [Actinomycetota bacterium]
MTTKTSDQQETDEEETTAERVKQEAGRVGEAARQEGGRLVDEARHQGRELLTEARNRMGEEAQSQTRRAAENLRSMSSDFRAMADSSQEQGTAVSWVRMGADRIESLAERLDDGGFEGMVRDVGNFARRSPTTFLALTFGAGLVAGRLVKNVDRDRLGELEAGSGTSGESQTDLGSKGRVGTSSATQSGTGQQPHQDVADTPQTPLEEFESGTASPSGGVGS